jgi:hypothetical protein
MRHHFVAMPPAVFDKSRWRRQFFAFCFGASLGRDRKSFAIQRFDFVGAEGVPVSGDIIRPFCRFRLAESPCFPVQVAIAIRQKGAAFCRIFFHLIQGFERKVSRKGAKAQSERWLIAHG